MTSPLLVSLVNKIAQETNTACYSFPMRKETYARTKSNFTTLEEITSRLNWVYHYPGIKKISAYRLLEIAILKLSLVNLYCILLYPEVIFFA